MAAVPHRPTGYTEYRRPYGGGWLLRRPTDQCDGPPSALQGLIATALDRPISRSPLAGSSGRGGGCVAPTDRATASSPPYGAGWRLRRIDRPSDSLPPALRAGWLLRRTDRERNGFRLAPRGRVTAAPDRPTARWPPVGLTGLGGGCTGPADECSGLPPAQRGLRRTDCPVRQPPGGNTGPGRCSAKPTDQCDGLLPEVRPLVAAASDRSTVRRPPAGPTGPVCSCTGPDDRFNGLQPTLRGRVAAAADRATAYRRPYGGGGAGPYKQCAACHRPYGVGWRLHLNDGPVAAAPDRPTM